METRSRFSSVNVYIPIAVMLGLMGVGFYLGFHPGIVIKGSRGQTNNEQAIALFLVFAPAFIMFLLIIQFKRITVNDHSIVIQSLFKKHIITRDEVISVNIFARGSSGFFGPRGYINGICCTLKTAEDLFVPDAYIQNIAEIKDALKTNFSSFVIQNKPALKTAQRVSSSFNNAGTSEKFSGNAVFTFNTFYCLGIAAAVVYVYILAASRYGNRASDFMLLIPAAIFFFVFGSQMNYFIISGDQLIIKNHYFWWRNTAYDINNINQVVVENRTKGSNMLEINFNDYSAKKYAAGSLRKPAWEALLQKLSSFGVDANSEIAWIKVNKALM